MKLYVTPNPLLARLIHRQTKLSLLTEIICTTCLLGISVVFITASFLPGNGALVLCFGPPLTLFALTSIGLIPILITSHTWRITANHLRDNSDELLLLTNLSSRAILGAYVAAVLYRWRSVLCWIIGLMPAMVFSLAFTLLIFQTGFDENWCIKSPLGIHYCDPSDPEPGMTAEAKLYLEIQLSIAGICASMGILGINLLAALIGAGVAYWLRNKPHVSIGAMMLFSSAALVWTVLFIELAFSALLSPAPQATLKVAFFSLLFASAPYILALGWGKLCQRWVRKLP